MEMNELRAALRAGPPAGWFLFCGEEEYLTRYYLGRLRAAILQDPSSDAFNHLRMEGESIDYGRLLDAVQSPPLFADRKLVEWQGTDFNRMKEKDLDAFCEFCALAPQYPEVTLVFRATPPELDTTGLPRRPSRVYRRLSEALQVVCFPRAGEGQLLSWLVRHFTDGGLNAPAPACRTLIDYCGHSMDILAQEVEKLIAFAHAHEITALTPELIARVTAPAGESEAFGLSNALLDGNTAEAYRQLLDLKRRKVDPLLTAGQVAHLYADLYAVRMLQEEGKTAAEIAAALGMNAYKAGLYCRAAAKRSIASLREALALCAEMDSAAKTGRGGYRNLECLLAAGL